MGKLKETFTTVVRSPNSKLGSNHNGMTCDNHDTFPLLSNSFDEDKLRNEEANSSTMGNIKTFFTRKIIGSDSSSSFGSSFDSSSADESTLESDFDSWTRSSKRCALCLKRGKRSDLSLEDSLSEYKLEEFKPNTEDNFTEFKQKFTLCPLSNKYNSEEQKVEHRCDKFREAKENGLCQKSLNLLDENDTRTEKGYLKYRFKSRKRKNKNVYHNSLNSPEDKDSSNSLDNNMVYARKKENTTDNQNSLKSLDDYAILKKTSFKFFSLPSMMRNRGKETLIGLPQDVIVLDYN